MNLFGVFAAARRSCFGDDVAGFEQGERESIYVARGEGVRVFLFFLFPLSNQNYLSPEIVKPPFF